MFSTTQNTHTMEIPEYCNRCSPYCYPPIKLEFLLAFKWMYPILTCSQIFFFNPFDAACPALKKVPHVLVIHGESDATVEHMKV